MVATASERATMPAAPWRWELHRLLVDRAGLLRPFSRRAGSKKVLFLSERPGICQAQIFPFFLHARELAIEHRIEMRELPLHRFLAGRNPYRGPLDAVCVQTWFDLSRADIEALIGRIKSAWPGAAIAYFDWFAPTDLRYAEALDPHIAAYVKKQILKDRQSYGGVTLGDTNLTDHYARRFKIDMPETRFPIPSGFFDKLVLGPSFEYSPVIVRNLAKEPNYGGRTIDLHARIATKGSDWYSEMRREAFARTEELDGAFKVAFRGWVSTREYFAELRNSKLCFSPFGYGEVCWRDFEAMSTGALLLKPDMSHLKLAGDFFRPYETYVPLKWDFGNFRQKVEHYVHHASEREAIARNAFEMLAQAYRDKRFLRDIAPLWRLLGIG
jgi:hypothetical protein